MRNKELVFGDIVEDVETSIRYCVFKSLTSAKCSKNFLACLEISSDNIVINHVNKIFDKLTVKDFNFVGNMALSLEQYVGAMNLVIDKDKIKKLCFVAKRT